MSTIPNISQDVIISRTLSVLGATTLQSVTCTNLFATTASLTNGTIQTGNLGTLNVTSSLNTRDPSTGVLVSAAASINGGCIISLDLLVKGSSTFNTVAANTLNTAKLNASDLSTLSSLNVTNTSSLSQVNVGGRLTLTSTADYTSPSAPGSFSYAGGGLISGSLAIGPSTTVLSSAIVTTNSAQTGTNTASNILRLRSNDVTNPAVRISIANTAMASSYYDSSLVLWTLGSSISSTNYERMLLGVNSNGGYLNYLYGGTGTLKPFDILQGAVFSMGGALQLKTSLNVNGVTRVAAPTTPYTLTEPPTLPTTNGLVLSSSTTGVQSWTSPGYGIWTGDGVSVAPTSLGNINPKWYVFTQTLQSTSGQMVFYLTSTGTSSGTVLGTGNFLGIMFAARAPSSAASTTLGPTASEAYRGTNGVVCNVYTNRTSTIVVGGTANGSQAAPTGTIVTCFALIN